MRDKLRPCWGNCGLLDDKSMLADDEILNIDQLEDSISPLDDNTQQIREHITGLEPCYFQADKEAEMIIREIGSLQPIPEAKERPPERQRQLQNSFEILSAWCQGDLDKCTNLDVNGISAHDLVACLKNPTDLQIWQVQRVIEKLKIALRLPCTYHNMELAIDGYGQPIDLENELHYKGHLDFLEKTTETIINFKLDGEDSQLSLAVSIDLFQPGCNWNFVGNLVIILKAIAGDLNPESTFAPCCFNAKLTPLRNRLLKIANTLGYYWKDKQTTPDIDKTLFDILGKKTDKKLFLAASLDKTIRLQQAFRPPTEL